MSGDEAQLDRIRAMRRRSWSRRSRSARRTDEQVRIVRDEGVVRLVVEDKEMVSTQSVERWLHGQRWPILFHDHMEKLPPNAV